MYWSIGILFILIGVIIMSTMGFEDKPVREQQLLSQINNPMNTYKRVDTDTTAWNGTSNPKPHQRRHIGALLWWENGQSLGQQELVGDVATDDYMPGGQPLYDLNYSTVLASDGYRPSLVNSQVHLRGKSNDFLGRTLTLSLAFLYLEGVGILFETDSIIVEYYEGQIGVRLDHEQWILEVEALKPQSTHLLTISIGESMSLVLDGVTQEGHEPVELVNVGEKVSNIRSDLCTFSAIYYGILSSQDDLISMRRVGRNDWVNTYMRPTLTLVGYDDYHRGYVNESIFLGSKNWPASDPEVTLLEVTEPGDNHLFEFRKAEPEGGLFRFQLEPRLGVDEDLYDTTSLAFKVEKGTLDQMFEPAVDAIRLHHQAKKSHSTELGLPSKVSVLILCDLANQLVEDDRVAYRLVTTHEDLVVYHDDLQAFQVIIENREIVLQQKVHDLSNVQAGFRKEYKILVQVESLEQEVILDCVYHDVSTSGPIERGYLSVLDDGRPAGCVVVDANNSDHLRLTIHAPTSDQVVRLWDNANSTYDESQESVLSGSPNSYPGSYDEIGVLGVPKTLIHGDQSFYVQKPVGKGNAVQRFAYRLDDFYRTPYVEVHWTYDRLLPPVNPSRVNLELLDDQDVDFSLNLNWGETLPPSAEPRSFTIWDTPTHGTTTTLHDLGLTVHQSGQVTGRLRGSLLALAPLRVNVYAQPRKLKLVQNNVLAHHADHWLIGRVRLAMKWKPFEFPERVVVLDSVKTLIAPLNLVQGVEYTVQSNQSSVQASVRSDGVIQLTGQALHELDDYTLEVTLVPNARFISYTQTVIVRGQLGTESISTSKTSSEEVGEPGDAPSVKAQKLLPGAELVVTYPSRPKLYHGQTSAEIRPIVTLEGFSVGPELYSPVLDFTTTSLVKGLILDPRNGYLRYDGETKLEGQAFVVHSRVAWEDTPRTHTIPILLEGVIVYGNTDTLMISSQEDNLVIPFAIGNHTLTNFDITPALPTGLEMNNKGIIKGRGIFQAGQWIVKAETSEGIPYYGALRLESYDGTTGLGIGDHVKTLNGYGYISFGFMFAGVAMVSLSLYDARHSST